jgi:hypothetical protein
MVLTARFKSGFSCMQFLCLVLINAMAEKVLSLKYVDPNGSKAVTALRPGEGQSLLTSHQNSDRDCF